MGRLSDKKRSARRPGRRERARVKKRHRTQLWSVSRAGTYRVKAGRKKWSRTVRAVAKAHHAGDPIIPNALVAVKRRDYKTATGQFNKEVPE